MCRFEVKIEWFQLDYPMYEFSKADKISEINFQFYADVAKTENQIIF